MYIRNLLCSSFALPRSRFPSQSSRGLLKQRPSPPSSVAFPFQTSSSSSPFHSTIIMSSAIHRPLPSFTLAVSQLCESSIEEYMRDLAQSTSPSPAPPVDLMVRTDVQSQHQKDTRCSYYLPRKPLTVARTPMATTAKTMTVITGDTRTGSVCLYGTSAISDANPNSWHSAGIVRL